MPIIFAQAIMFLPTLVTLGKQTDGARTLSAIFTDHQNGWYMLIYSMVVIGFTFLYTALIFNPKQIADNLKQNNGFIPGVKPGQPTADYIGAVMDKITFPGAILLGGYWYPAGYRATAWCDFRIFYLLWRYFTADHGRCNTRHTAADRNAIIDAAI